MSKIIGIDLGTTNSVVAVLEGGETRSGRVLPPRSTVPMLGFAQAGTGGFFDDAGFPAGQGWELIELPAPRAEGSYALQVQGDSMLPLYRHGDILVVEPEAPVRNGDRVVVKTVDGEVMAKILERRSERTVDLVSLMRDM